MKKRLVIITEIIAPYRVPVFNALARRDDVKLHVIFLSETDPSLREWRVPKAEIEFSYEVLPCFRKRVGKYNVLLNRGVTLALRKAAPEVVICGGYSYIASWQALAWSRRNSIPIVLWAESTARDQRRGHAGVERLKKRFFDLADAFVVPGKASADYLKSFGVDPADIFYAPNAVDTALFSKRFPSQIELDSRLPRQFFLHVGRLVHEKGVSDLLAAYEKLAPELRQKFGLVIAGNGTARQQLEEWARQINPGNIVFTGFLQKENLALVYAHAYALVFPTHSDPWGLIVNEGIAAGLPIIASSAAGCVPDLVQDGWNGRVISPGDVNQLVAAMDSVARDGQIRETMSAHSRERSRAFTAEACAAGLAKAAKFMEAVVG